MGEGQRVRVSSCSASRRVPRRRAELRELALRFSELWECHSTRCYLWTECTPFGASLPIRIRLQWNDHPAQIAKLGSYPASTGLPFQLLAPRVHSDVPPHIGYANAAEALPRPFDAPRPRLRDVEHGTRSILRLAPSARAVLASVFSVILFSLPDSICAIIG